MKTEPAARPSEDATAARARAYVGLWSTLRRRDFALLWTAGLLSNLGSWATFVAIPVLVFTETGSGVVAALTFTVSVVPRLLGSVAGVVVDRHDRRRVLVAANLTLALLTLPLLLVWAGHIWVVFVVMFALNLVGLLVPPAENALLPTLVGRDRLLSANILNALNDNLARVAGPAVGGLVLASGGFAAAVVLNVATFLLAALLVLAMRRRSSTGDAGEPSGGARLSWWSDGRAGLRALAGSAITLLVVGGALGAMVADAVYSSLLGPFTVEVLVADGAFLGVFLAVRGLGGIAGGFLVAPLSRRLGSLPVMAGSIIGLGLVLAGIVTMPQLPVALAGAAVGGVLVIGWTANQQTLIQTRVDGAFLGRAYGTLGTLGAVAMIIGSGLGAAIAGALGPAPAMYVSAALSVITGATVLLVLARRRFRDPGHSRGSSDDPRQ